MTKPRVVLVGASHWHTPLYMAGLHEHFDLIGVVDADPEVAARYAGDAAWERELPERFLDADIAFVLGRHDAMAPTTTKFLEQGIPVVLEKPGAARLRDLELLADTARSASVPVVVPLVHRYAPFASLLQSLEEPRYLAISYLAGPPDRYRAAGCEWLLERSAGGGVLVNLGPHFIDLFERIAGSPIIGVRAMTQRAQHGLDIEDHAVLVLTAETGAVASIELGYVYPDSVRKRHFSASLAGRDGHISIGPDGDAIVTGSSGARRLTLEVDSDVLFAPFLKRVAGRLGEGLAGLPQIEDLVRAMRVVDQAYADADDVDVLPDRGGIAWAM